MGRSKASKTGTISGPTSGTTRDGPTTDGFGPKGSSGDISEGPRPAVENMFAGLGPDPAMGNSAMQDALKGTGIA